MIRPVAALSAAAALVCLAACEEPRRSVVTGWFAIEDQRPPTIPDVLELGPPRQRALVWRGDGWRQVHSGRDGVVCPLDGGEAVFLESARKIFRRDADPVSVDAACPADAYVAGATQDGRRLACAVLRPGPEGCDSVHVALLDGRGTVRRTDSLVQPKPCRWDARRDRELQVWILGLAPGDDPVVLVRGREGTGGPFEWLVFVLDPAGAREVATLRRSPGMPVLPARPVVSGGTEWELDDRSVARAGPGGIPRFERLVFFPR